MAKIDSQPIASGGRGLGPHRRCFRSKRCLAFFGIMFFWIDSGRRTGQVGERDRETFEKLLSGYTQAACLGLSGTAMLLEKLGRAL
ncbi:uncharacterized protein CIMG_07838 [Coccidioides immitis RS]|uniref:Uncharacterized protein n=4 Tax=Coccidioides immitis TaxID=5501 RepID=J3K485_COCIM|nr:uncharacterized protein CIMG_07838 [Coccidioides immitis RS]EAS29092.3 hypothetical protein CIMG_07838 [Coccidioides immitis RS]KMP06207.1 hypothetical protein CIRG_05888 [Coccidioides immitis RMSCC 2394]KMU78322.1 hypothetical protein CISG_06558 [Coccidioides immitis RMSCC 3703]KMU91251.1 hypothetical protein CIHG_09063 [Coccidioides immitis H538.4]